MVAARRADPPPDVSLPALAYEHGVLARQWGQAQVRVSALLAEQEARLQTLTRDLIRARGELLRWRSAAAWGIAPTRGPDQPPRDPLATPGRRFERLAQGKTRRALARLRSVNTSPDADGLRA